jgi:hypothetical protein
MAQDTLTRVTPDALMWKENPAFPKGVQIATLVGDPTKAGDVVGRMVGAPIHQHRSRRGERGVLRPAPDPISGPGRW